MYKLHASKMSCHNFYVTGLSQIDLVSYILAAVVNSVLVIGSAISI